MRKKIDMLVWPLVLRDQCYALALQVENLDAACCRSAQPVSVRAEYEGVYGIACLERVQVFAIVEIPEHGDTILATRGSKRPIGRYRHSVDVPSVPVVICAQLAFGKLPYLISNVISLVKTLIITGGAKQNWKAVIRDLGDKLLSHRER